MCPNDIPEGYIDDDNTPLEIQCLPINTKIYPLLLLHKEGLLNTYPNYTETGLHDFLEENRNNDKAFCGSVSFCCPGLEVKGNNFSQIDCQPFSPNSFNDGVKITDYNDDSVYEYFNAPCQPIWLSSNDGDRKAGFCRLPLNSCYAPEEDCIKPVQYFINNFDNIGPIENCNDILDAVNTLTANVAPGEEIQLPDDPLADCFAMPLHHLWLLTEYNWITIPGYANSELYDRVIAVGNMPGATCTTIEFCCGFNFNVISDGFDQIDCSGIGSTTIYSVPDEYVGPGNYNSTDYTVEGCVMEDVLAPHPTSSILDISTRIYACPEGGNGQGGRIDISKVMLGPQNADEEISSCSQFYTRHMEVFN